MNRPLWTWEELLAAAHGTADGAPDTAITGFSIDTRTIAPGEVFVALKDQRDGHDFVPSAFEHGAAAALVSTAYMRKAHDGALLRVADPLGGLGAIGKAARSRTAARIIAVTGSVGKTGTKDMLRLCLSRLGKTHAPEKSYNNHWGVPLTLARMPSHSEFAVFEIGMNHAGEITPLSRMVEPHIAMVLNVELAHLGQFASVEDIAEAKAEIFLGLAGGGTAVINRDSPHFELLGAHATPRAGRTITFGTHRQADVRLARWQLEADFSDVEASVLGRRLVYRVGAPGAHLAFNSLGVVAALAAAEVDVEAAAGGLADVRAQPGRGARCVLKSPTGAILLIDESYNANPASTRAALEVLAMVPRTAYARRIAVLGDMLELGPMAADLHRELKSAIDAAGVDLVFACGPMMRLLFDALPASRQARWAGTSAELESYMMDVVRGGDAVMIKGSLGSRMGPLATALSNRFGAR